MSSFGGSTAPRIQVFRPTMEEFKNFSQYIEKIESQGAHKAGLAKIIPPDGWTPRNGYDNIDLIIPAPIIQDVTGSQGLYQQINIQRKAMTVKEFKVLANNKKYSTPAHFDYEDLERKYWKNITFNAPIYGADVSGSLYDKNVEEFNIQHLNTILDMVKEDYEIQIEGVNTAYLYFGMWKTTFAWHTEDMDLYSINYLHFGAPKSWYVVPPEHGRRLERLAAEPGEFMITFPFAYHSGFNHGFNCAESTNFALPRWVEYGKRTLSCTCRNDCVKICMDMFVRKFQPERYELWKAGKDFGSHPEDPSRHYAAPPPRKAELAILSRREERKKTKVSQRRHPVSNVKKAERQIRTTEVPSQESDEDTELYDVNEVIYCEKPKKKMKKKARESVSKVHLEMKIKRDPEPTTVLETSTEVVSKNEIEIKAETSFQDKLEEKPNGTDSPPELQPFWHPDMKNKGNEVTVSQVTVKNDHSSWQGNFEFINKYPNLRQLINNGDFSVFSVNPVVDQKVPLMSSQEIENHSAVSENSVLKIQSLQKSKDILSSNSGSTPSNPIASNTWRCEPTDGLKMKLIQQDIGKSTMNNSIDTEKNVASLATEKSVLNVSVTEEKKESLAQKNKLKEMKQTKETRQKNKEQKKCAKKSKNELTTNYSLNSSLNSSGVKVQRADISQENWAHPLRKLWQHQPHNFEAEIEFNKKFASIPPHCAICVLFTPMYNKSHFPTEPSDVPSYSSVQMPAYCYGNSLNSECMLDTNSLLRPDGTGPLLICSICKVCVHASCYGISLLPMGSSWTCTRCAREAIAAECCLCVLRGGALKPTNDNRWAHIICAVLITETYFENTAQKQPVNVSKITPTRQRLKCKYCLKTSLPKASKGTCVQCQSGKCYLPYHVTCGYMAGVIFETNDWPEPIHMICTRHAAARRKPPKRQLTNVFVGEKVIAKHKNKRYYWAVVKRKYIQEYYSILFEDNSHSTNTLPEDIVSRNVSVYGSPQMNEKVQVKWTDDKVYNGIFKGSQSCELYVIEFDDESVLHQERKQIYAADEELPKEVLAKISTSSDRRNIDFEVEPEGKRIRVNNHRYS
ncbi:lysine-specific demethylase 4A [Trichonephila inaurata madagascariensis]|uniref:[histone H3]-trimethyl-L-lysine(9) demethylase n=1 Tax=Trichonephila inaurata madagascariensis TaxID=2747483 RepID=A0A8X6XQ21_9ARAC|nr:lysine-specific demethylase 4A [Trichonephila inaurata madagascariensis]